MTLMTRRGWRSLAAPHRRRRTGRAHQNSLSSPGRTEISPVLSAAASGHRTGHNVAFDKRAAPREGAAPHTGGKVVVLVVVGGVGVGMCLGSWKRRAGSRWSHLCGDNAGRQQNNELPYCLSFLSINTVRVPVAVSLCQSGAQWRSSVLALPRVAVLGRYLVAKKKRELKNNNTFSPRFVPASSQRRVSC